MVKTAYTLAQILNIGANKAKALARTTPAASKAVASKATSVAVKTLDTAKNLNWSVAGPVAGAGATAGALAGYVFGKTKKKPEDESVK